MYTKNCSSFSLYIIINFAVVKLLRTATEEKVRERQREAQSREGTFKKIRACLSTKSFKILVWLNLFGIFLPPNPTDGHEILHTDSDPSEVPGKTCISKSVF